MSSVYTYIADTDRYTVVSVGPRFSRQFGESMYSTIVVSASSIKLGYKFPISCH